MRIPIGISNRHIHLSAKDIELLFGKGYQLQTLKKLSQPGEFAATETVTLVGEKGFIEHVRIIWPQRKTTQVELLFGDQFLLWVQAPIKISWDTHDLWYIKIVGPVGEIYGPYALIAQRHLHCTVKEAEDLWIKDGDTLQMSVGTVRKVLFENIVVRAKDTYALDFHIDIEEANAAGIQPGDRAELIK